jgi:hypothetical protein
MTASPFNTFVIHPGVKAHELKRCDMGVLEISKAGAQWGCNEIIMLWAMPI